MKLEFLGQIKEYDKPVMISDLLEKTDIKYIAATVNNRIREMNYIVKSDAKIEFLDLTNLDAANIYQATLRYIFVMATRRLFPKSRVIFNYSISRSIFASISDIRRPVDQEIVDQINNEIQNIIKEEIPIKRSTLTKEEAIKYYESVGMKDKVNILAYREEDTVHIYECAEYKNYMFGYMLSNTKYLSNYILKLYTPGILIQYPRAECGGVIPPFEDAKRFGQALREANVWGNIMDGTYISQMNAMINDKRSNEFINLCETRHNNMLADLGNEIKSKIEDIKLIAVAGPSSSGKTTFTNRLRIELMTRGIYPLMISIDDFYLGKQHAPLDEYGKPDLEHIDALDIKLFNDTLFKLINGEKVMLPKFNFMKSMREDGPIVKLKKNQPIMIEGIHALNDDLTPSIPLHQKYKIYISPQAQLHIDDQNPISISDIRLIRRIVRDYLYRNHNAVNTMDIWASVRRGEFKWIYPYQEKANYVYNSELTYELCVMKKYAIPLLEAVDPMDAHYITANRLIKFLKYFKDIPDKWIPCNSILREFIGGSMFYEE